MYIFSLLYSAARDSELAALRIGADCCPSVRRHNAYTQTQFSQIAKQFSAMVSIDDLYLYEVLGVFKDHWTHKIPDGGDLPC